MKEQRKIRLSLDISAEQHIHLKMLAAKRGMSMREYILESLAFRESAEEKQPDCIHLTHAAPHPIMLPTRKLQLLETLQPFRIEMNHPFILS